jgi:hypothetical protein
MHGPGYQRERVIKNGRFHTGTPPWMGTLDWPSAVAIQLNTRRETAAA